MGWEIKGTPEPVKNLAAEREDLPVAPAPIPGVANPVVESKTTGQEETDGEAK